MPKLRYCQMLLLYKKSIKNQRNICTCYQVFFFKNIPALMYIMKGGGLLISLSTLYVLKTNRINKEILKPNKQLMIHVCIDTMPCDSCMEEITNNHGYLLLNMAIFPYAVHLWASMTGCNILLPRRPCLDFRLQSWYGIERHVTSAYLAGCLWG